MTRQKQIEAWSFEINRGTAAAVLTIGFMLAVAISQPLQAQTFTVIHAFTGGGDGGDPMSGLTMDSAGNFYGTTWGGGTGYGTVFKLWHVGGGWRISPIYSFAGGADGAGPQARVVFGPDGSLYGTTSGGGGGSCSDYGYYGCGTVFKLTPPATACKAALCPWTETVLYRAAPDGGGYLVGEVVFDPAGNLYTTAALGGQGDGGYVIELSPYYGGWTSKIVHTFQPEQGDVSQPECGLVFDSSGNLYGTGNLGGASSGGVFRLAPSGSGWTESVIHAFEGSDGNGSMASLTPDGYGGFYGTTFDLGPNSGGTVFDLTPAGGNWNFSLVYGFNFYDDNGSVLVAPVTLGANGNLYGTTFECLHCRGVVFELTPSSGGWTETVLHRFDGGDDGGIPWSSVVFDSSGNLYGTASFDGATGRVSSGRSRRKAVVGG